MCTWDHRICVCGWWTRGETCNRTPTSALHPQSWTRGSLTPIDSGLLWFEPWTVIRGNLYFRADECVWMAFVQPVLGVMNPSLTPPPHRPSLPSPRITHAQLSDCTVLSQNVSTQDHQCSHLWAASFGAIVSVVTLLSETFSSAMKDELWRTAMMCWYQPKGPSQIWVQQSLWIGFNLLCLLYYTVFSFSVEWMHLADWTWHFASQW